MSVHAIKVRKRLEAILIPNEKQLKEAQEIWNKYEDYAHAHMIDKLTSLLIPVRQEYKRFEKQYPKRKYPEVWV